MPYARRYLPWNAWNNHASRKVETRKFSLVKKKKKPGPKKQNDSIEEAKKIRLAASFHTTWRLFPFLFLVAPLLSNYARPISLFHYQSGQSAIRYNKSWLIMQCWMPFPANSKLFCHKPSSGNLTSIFIGRRHHSGVTAFTPALTRCEKM